jgi:hypothetical protein
MRRSIVAFVVVVSLVGCGTSESKPVVESKTAAPLVAADLVGRWQFVFTDEVRDRYKARIAATIEDPAELEKAMKDADEEARASELEFTKDGIYVSRVLGEELIHRPYQVGVTSPTTVLLEQGTAKKEIVFVDHDTISIDEPNKGHLIYTRVK